MSEARLPCCADLIERLLVGAGPAALLVGTVADSHMMAPGQTRRCGVDRTDRQPAEESQTIGIPPGRRGTVTDPGDGGGPLDKGSGKRGPSVAEFDHSPLGTGTIAANP